MKRRALLIGNSKGLGGVKKDIVNFKAFLMGIHGGAWNFGEIEMLMNPSKSLLLDRINRIKAEENDFVITMFSGHGGYQRTTILEINGDGEVIEESKLWSLAPKQISIFDCCRTVCDYTEEREILNEVKTFSRDDEKTFARHIYENRIGSAAIQQNKLYACSIGQCAYDNGEEGAYYLKNLIRSAKTITGSYGLVGDVHDVAAQGTHTEVMISQNAIQDPVANLPKLLSAQQLILSVSI